MKLVYLTRTFPFGGGEGFLRPEAREFVRRRVDLLVVPRSPKGPLRDGGEGGIGAKVMGTGLFSWRVVGLAAATSVFSWSRPWAVARIALDSGSPVKILKNLSVAPKALWLARLVQKLGVDHIHVHWGGTTSTLAYMVSRLTGVGWSMTLHRWDIVEGNLLQEKVSAACFVRVISKNGVEMLRRRGISWKEGKVSVTHIGVEPIPPGQTKGSQESHDSSDFVVLCPARLIAVKGHRFLFEAVAALREGGWSVKLLLAGEGPERGRLSRLSQSLGIEKSVEWLGDLPQDHLFALLDSGVIGAVVLPSVDLGGGEHEGIPVSLMEAMAREVPVVSTRSGGIPELIDAECGVLVPPADSGAMAAAIRRLMADPRYAGRIAVNGRRRVEEQFNAEETTARVLDRIVECLSSELESRMRTGSAGVPPGQGFL